MNHGIRERRQDGLRAVTRDDEIADPGSGGSADLGGDVKVLRGVVEFADPKRLVLEASEGEPNRYVFGIAGATIRMGSKNGSVDDLHRGDIVGVLYKEAKGVRIARMVLVTDTERR
jgi:hypothetical protein